MEKKLFTYVPNDSNGATPKEIFLVGDFGGGGTSYSYLNEDDSNKTLNIGSYQSEQTDTEVHEINIKVSNQNAYSGIVLSEDGCIDSYIQENDEASTAENDFYMGTRSSYIHNLVETSDNTVGSKIGSEIDEDPNFGGAKAYMMVGSYDQDNEKEASIEVAAYKDEETGKTLSIINLRAEEVSINEMPFGYSVITLIDTGSIGDNVSLPGNINGVALYNYCRKQLENHTYQFPIFKCISDYFLSTESYNVWANYTMLRDHNYLIINIIANGIEQGYSYILKPDGTFELERE